MPCRNGLPCSREPDGRLLGTEPDVSFSAEASEKMEMRMFGTSFRPTAHVGPAEWRLDIRRMTLRISVPASSKTIGTCVVSYQQPQREIAAVVKDVLLGLDMIRQRKPASGVQLKGPPGQL